MTDRSLPAEHELVPTQAIAPRARLEEPTSRDVPAQVLDDMDAEPVPADHVEVVLQP